MATSLQPVAVSLWPLDKVPSSSLHTTMAPRPSDPPPPPTFDARLFEPPTWATDGFHASRARQTGEASSSREPVQADAHDHDHDHAHAHDHDHDNAEEAPEELPTAFDLGVEVDDSDTLQFTTTELKVDSATR